MNAVPGPTEFVDRTPGLPDVRGFIHRPETPNGDALVLTHGAGANAESPLLVALATAFAGAGMLVLRCDLPFRQARRTGPPSPRSAPIDREGLRVAALAARALVPGRVFLGGHSYGGRQASMLAAATPGVASALLLLAYPLHPPARPAELRTAHFPELRTEALFVHGTADPFGTVEELGATLSAVSATTRLVTIEGAGHDLGRGRRRQGADVTATVVREFLSFVSLQRATGRSSRLPHSTHDRS